MPMQALRGDGNVAPTHSQPQRQKVLGVSITRRALYPRGRHGTHCTGSWVGPRASMEGCINSRPRSYSILH